MQWYFDLQDIYNWMYRNSYCISLIKYAMYLLQTASSCNYHQCVKSQAYMLKSYVDHIVVS